jgi:type I restriction enzyme S subunit
MNRLPQGWHATRLGELGEWSSGGTPSRKEAANFGGAIPWVKTGDLHHQPIDQVEEAITETGLATSAAKVFPCGTLLVAMYGATIGQTGVLTFDAATNQACAALIAKGSTAEIIPYVWRYIISVQDELKAIGQGGAQPNISQTILKNFPIRIAPLPEQRRIVTKIDSLSAKSRRARDHLDHIPRLVEKYKQAILAAAFSNDATTGWASCRLESIISDALIGLVRSKSEQSTTGGVPYIRMNHFDLEGRLNEDDLTRASVTDHEASRYALLAGDILFNTRNSYELVGKVAIWPEGKSEHVYNNNLLRLRFIEDIIPKFAYLQMMAEPFRRYLQSVKSATTSVCAIYQRSIMEASFRYPEPAQQRKIANRIDSAFAWIDRVASEATSSRKLIDHLHQAILAKAFRGELVSQDTNDEPASELLTRIHTQRTVQQGPAAADRPRKAARKRVDRQTSLFD